MKPALRRKARRYIVQALYQWSMTQATAAELAAQFLTDNDPKSFDGDYFREVVEAVVAEPQVFDQLLTPYVTEREADQVDPIEQAILRMACYELQQRVDVPYRVVINEALELAKVFASDQSHRFINGVLDPLAITLRQPEVEHHRQKARLPSDG